MNQPFVRRKLLRTLFACICVLALVALTMESSSCRPAASPSTLNSPLSTPGAPTLTEVALRQKLVAKATDLAHINQTEAARRLLPPPPPGHILPTPLVRATAAPVSTAFPPVSGSDATPAGAGMIVVRPSHFAISQYRIGSQWIEDIYGGRTRIEVEAGVENGPDGLPSAQGIVIVEVWQRTVITNGVVTDNLVGEDFHPTPTQAGPVKVVGAIGERLILQSVTDGTTFYFDVPSRQYVASLTSVVPTPTPGPISPIATPTTAP